MMKMTTNLTIWKGVIIPPPNPLAGLGCALRHAFILTADARSRPDFDALLDRLDEGAGSPTAH